MPLVDVARSAPRPTPSRCTRRSAWVAGIAGVEDDDAVLAVGGALTGEDAVLAVLGGHHVVHDARVGHHRIDDLRRGRVGDVDGVDPVGDGASGRRTCRSDAPTTSAVRELDRHPAHHLEPAAAPSRFATSTTASADGAAHAPPSRCTCRASPPRTRRHRRSMPTPPEPPVHRPAHRRRRPAPCRRRPRTSALKRTTSPVRTDGLVGRERHLRHRAGQDLHRDGLRGAGRLGRDRRRPRRHRHQRGRRASPAPPSGCWR